MTTIVLEAEKLNLPEAFAQKLRGKKVELTENGNIITIKPTEDAITSIQGIVESDGHEADRFITRKRSDKALEYRREDAIEAWEGFKKYKGIIRYTIDEKVELADARDEKYANFN